MQQAKKMRRDCRRANCRYCGTDYFCASTHLTRVWASASLTCGLAGIGIAPQVPEPPFMTFATSLLSASFWPAYLAATSLNAGPTNFVLTAWQAMQFFAFARSGLAIAICDVNADTATTATNMERFIVFSPKLLPAAFYRVSAGSLRAQIKRFIVVNGWAPVLCPDSRRYPHFVCKAL